MSLDKRAASGSVWWMTLATAACLGACGSNTPSATSAGGSGNAQAGSLSGGTGGAGETSGGSGGSMSGSAAGGTRSFGGFPPTIGDPPNDIKLNPCPPPGEQCSIIGIGDSITAGFKSSKGPYLNYITPMIEADGKSLKYVGNAGYPGFTIMPGGGREGISDHVEADIKNFKPHVVTLMIGTNDVDIELDLDNAPARLGGLLDQMLMVDPNLLIIVAKIVPSNHEGRDDKVQRYNSGLPAIVKERQDAGKRVWLVDMHAAFLQNPNWKTELMDSDGLHPIDAGFEVMAAVWYGALKRLD
jgi:lysophospholipase L1-like esterase